MLPEWKKRTLIQWRKHLNMFYSSWHFIPIKVYRFECFWSIINECLRTNARGSQVHGLLITVSGRKASQNEDTGTHTDYNVVEIEKKKNYTVWGSIQCVLEKYKCSYNNGNPQQRLSRRFNTRFHGSLSTLGCCVFSSQGSTQWFSTEYNDHQLHCHTHDKIISG